MSIQQTPAARLEAIRKERHEFAVLAIDIEEASAQWFEKFADELFDPSLKEVHAKKYGRTAGDTMRMLSEAGEKLQRLDSQRKAEAEAIRAALR